MLNVYLCVSNINCEEVLIMKGSTSVKVGDVFNVKGGTATVLKYKNRQQIYVEFNDEHKHKVWTRSCSILKGMVKNPYHRSVEGVGYLGVGRFKGYVNGKVTEEYSTWRTMLTRCHNEEFLSKHPTYLNCTVHEEWYNFQNFAYWYTREDEYGRGYCLDKDILVKGNKHYSPTTCCLVPSCINSFFSDSEKSSKSGGLPRGVKVLKSGKFSVRISINGKHRVIGQFNTVEEASDAYKRAKGIRAKELALDNKSNIRYKTFLAIMNWEF